MMKQELFLINCHCSSADIQTRFKNMTVNTIIETWRAMSPIRIRILLMNCNVSHTQLQNRLPKLTLNSFNYGQTERQKARGEDISAHAQIVKLRLRGETPAYAPSNIYYGPRKSLSRICKRDSDSECIVSNVITAVCFYIIQVKSGCQDGAILLVQIAEEIENSRHADAAGFLLQDHFTVRSLEFQMSLR